MKKLIVMLVLAVFFVAQGLVFADTMSMDPVEEQGYLGGETLVQEGFDLADNAHEDGVISVEKFENYGAEAAPE